MEDLAARAERRVINQIKGLVLTLFAAYWVAVIVIWIAARPVFGHSDFRAPESPRLP
jgi:hypothetical protein